MTMEESIYESERICLGSIDYEKDAEVESRWTHDSEYMRMLSLNPLYPLPPSQIKKQYEALDKEIEESKALFYFTIRLRSDDPATSGRLLGFVKIYWIEWNHGTACIQIGIGDPADRRKGYGSEALQLVMRFAFEELNLYRLSAHIPEYNTAALGLFKKAGFCEEVRRRQAIQRDLRRWDALILGLLHEEWLQISPARVSQEEGQRS